jgi:hypothetical protein
MDDLYIQHIHVHPLTIHITFTIKFCFHNYQISTHYLPNLGNFKTMILNVEKIHAIKF